VSSNVYSLFADRQFYLLFQALLDLLLSFDQKTQGSFVLQFGLQHFQLLLGKEGCGRAGYEGRGCTNNTAALCECFRRAFLVWALDDICSRDFLMKLKLYVSTESGSAMNAVIDVFDINYAMVVWSMVALSSASSASKRSLRDKRNWHKQ
jgi:hypothetical protein